MERKTQSSAVDQRRANVIVEVMKLSPPNRTRKKEVSNSVVVLLAFLFGLVVTLGIFYFSDNVAGRSSSPPHPLPLPRKALLGSPSSPGKTARRSVGKAVWEKWSSHREREEPAKGLLEHPLIVRPRVLDPYNASVGAVFALNPMPIVAVQPVSLGLSRQAGPNGSVRYGVTRRAMPLFVHDPSECIISKDVLAGGWEQGCVSWIAQAVRSMPGEFMMDIGANIGIFSLAAATAGADTLSFEPMLFNSELLAASAGTFAESGRGTVNLFKTALSSEAEPGSTVCIVRNGAPHKKKVGVNQGNGVVNTNTSSCDLGWESSERVPLNTVDKVLEEAFEGKDPPCVSAMKIDVEGFETRAIKGAARFMGGKCPPCHIQLEHVKAHAPKGERVLLDVLVDDYGYNCYIGTPTCYLSPMSTLKGPLNQTHRKDPISPHLPGWSDGDWICRMEDFERHPRCAKLPPLHRKRGGMAPAVARGGGR